MIACYAILMKLQERDKELGGNNAEGLQKSEVYQENTWVSGALDSLSDCDHVYMSMYRKASCTLVPRNGQHQCMCQCSVTAAKTSSNVASSTITWTLRALAMTFALSVSKVSSILGQCITSCSCKQVEMGLDLMSIH